METGEFMTGAALSGLLIVGGYLSPVIKKIALHKGGIEIETHDLLRQREENRDAATELSSEAERGEITVEPESEDITEAARVMTAELAFNAILDTSLFGGCDLHMYLLDADLGALRPFFGSSPRILDQRPWEPGVGAVGSAYQRQEFVLVQGQETHDGTYGLDPDQQDQHSDLQAVAAIPITNANDETIGVLAASERGHDPAALFLVGIEARELLASAALLCARVLVDLLGVFADGDDDGNQVVG